MDVQEIREMNTARNIGIAGLVGALIPILPLWAFFESRVEKRVRYEVQVADLEKDLTALELICKAEQKRHDSEMKELKAKVTGDLWTANEKLDRWILQMNQKKAEP